MIVSGGHMVLVCWTCWLPLVGCKYRRDLLGGVSMPKRRPLEELKQHKDFKIVLLLLVFSIFTFIRLAYFG